jgi:hypothetical protein
VSEPAKRPLHREGWSRPETLAERAGYAAETFFRRLGITIVFLAAALIIIIGIPTLSVLRTPAWTTARDWVEHSVDVEERLGGRVRAVAPRSYRIEQGKASIVVVAAIEDGPSRTIAVELEPVVGAERPWRVAAARLLLPDGRSEPIVVPRRRR